ncbi:hypothetical protein, partial [Methanosphaera sp.]
WSNYIGCIIFLGIVSGCISSIGTFISVIPSIGILLEAFIIESYLLIYRKYSYGLLYIESIG